MPVSCRATRPGTDGRGASPGLDGKPLDSRIAAVELLNLLRPTVAVAYFITYAALELLAHPHWCERLRAEDELLEPFAQEVRRLHAFFPFTAARVQDGFDWQGHHFPAGTRVMLDLWGTNREASRWTDPEAFQPERFVDWSGDAFSFVTQGGGDPAQGIAARASGWRSNCSSSRYVC